MKKFIFVGIFSLLIVFSFSKVYVEDGMVVFEYENPTANTVFVAGSFNNWSTSAWEMNYIDNVWVYEADLQPGKYEYKYVVNGTDWYEDPESPDYIPDPYGGRNSSFELILVNGELQIVTGLSGETGAASFISGEYEFGLKTKLEEETGFFASPQVTNEVILSLNPDVQNADLELRIGASSLNDSFQFKVYGMKALWIQENFSLGAFYKTEINPNYNFEYENPEKNLPGFGFYYSGNSLNLGTDLFSQDNKLKFGVFGNYTINDFSFSLLFDTVDSTSLVFRGDAFDFYVEVDVENSEFNNIIMGYEKEDVYAIKFGYSLLSKILTANTLLKFNEYDIKGAVYYEPELDNFYAFKIGGGYTFLESYRIGADIYYNADENVGYNLNFSGENMPFELGVSFGNIIEVENLNNFDENKYLTLTWSAEF